jgi:alpha-galactosidase
MKTFTATLLLSTLCAFALISLAPPSHAWDNGLALTPPMGWNSWNKFGCNVSEDLLKSMADGMVSSGMKDAGYQYVVIDDCWQVSRDADGNIVPDAQRFPNGMKALGDYIHSKGLKFGIYSDAGEKTCAGRPGSMGHEYQDALSYAKWGVDYLKYDWCHTGKRNAEEAYATMRDALKASGRPIVFSMCEWGTAKPWLWAADTGNLWRTTGDINDHWEGKKKWPDGGCCSLGMLDILDLQVGLDSFAGPGHWNDPDMLEVGNGGMTTNEYRAHFSLWCILAAPLIAGNDLRRMAPEIKEILTNKEVIALNQDPLGREAKRVWSSCGPKCHVGVRPEGFGPPPPPNAQATQTEAEGGTEIWSKPLQDGGRAVLLLNRGTTEAEITVPWTALAYPEHLSASVRDLWAHKDLGKFAGKFSAKVPSHDVVVVTVKP